jgi:hypothetical protein
LGGEPVSGVSLLEDITKVFSATVTIECLSVLGENVATINGEDINSG